MRIWYTNRYNFEFSQADPHRDAIRDMHMGYDWYIRQGHDDITMENIKETHDMVYDMPLIHDELENVFEHFQGEFMTPVQREKLLANGADHTSMSVGDIIETKNGLFFVDCCGFVKLGE